MRWIGTSLRLWPSSRMSPDWYWYSRLMQLNSVVLPAPLGPIRPQMSPRPTSKLTLSSATMPPNRTDTPRTLSNALPPLGASAERGGCAIGCREELCRSSLEVRKAARVIGGRVRSDNARLHCPLSDSWPCSIAAAGFTDAGTVPCIGGATMNIYQTGLDRCGANHTPLSPVSFVERSAEVVRRPGRRWCMARAATPGRRPASRSARLAAALRALGVGRGTTVSVMLANTPEMVEAHYAVPALGAVLNTLNTRLDAPLLAWQMNHCEAAGADHRPRVLAGDAQGAANPAARAWASSRVVIDVADSEYAGPGRAPGRARVRSAAGRARAAATAAKARRTNGTRSPSATPAAPPATPKASSPTTAAPT